MMIHRAVRVAVASGLAALALGGCSERVKESTAPTGDGVATEVVIRNFAFSAPTITIDRGTAVRWRNTTGTFHTVTSDDNRAFTERQTSTSGDTFEVRFDTPGRYQYHCRPHQALGMTGEIIVR